MRLRLTTPADFTATTREFRAHIDRTLKPHGTAIYDGLLDGLGEALAADLRQRTRHHAYAMALCVDDLGAQPSQVPKLTRQFLIGYSLPVTVLGTWVDGKSSPEADDWLSLDSASCAALSQWCAEGSGAAAALLRCRVAVERSIEKERRARFTTELLTDDTVWRLPERPGEYYRSECTYLRAAAAFTAAATGNPLTPREGTAFFLLGVARQGIDELEDIEEDLASGIVTLPTAAYCRAVGDSALIEDVWAGRLSPAVAAHRVREAAVAGPCLRLIREALDAAEEGLVGSRFGSLGIFVDWKRAWLEDRGRAYVA